MEKNLLRLVKNLRKFHIFGIMIELFFSKTESKGAFGIMIDDNLSF